MKDAVMFAQSVLEMADELAELREECARLRKVEERFRDYVREESEHHERMFLVPLMALASAK